MKRYEYKQINYQGWLMQSFINSLNELGLKGWHVVGVIPFKRTEDRLHISGTAILEREWRPESLFKGKPISELTEEEREEFHQAMLRADEMVLAQGR